MNIAIWLVIGGLIGWLASVMMGTDNREGLFLNVAIGVAGAYLGGMLLGGILGVGTMNDGTMSVGSILMAVAGAILLHFLLKLIRDFAAR